KDMRYPDRPARTAAEIVAMLNRPVNGEKTARVKNIIPQEFVEIPVELIRSGTDDVVMGAGGRNKFSTGAARKQRNLFNCLRRRRGGDGHRLSCRTQLKREVDRRDDARIHPHILSEQFLETLLFYLHGVGARQEIGDIVTADGSGGTQTSHPCCLINSGDACSSHYGPAGVEDCSAERAAACLSEKAAD